mgnify:FL=1
MFGSKKATIHVQTWNGKKEKEGGFQGVPAANNALSVHLAQSGSIVIDSEINEYDGKSVVALEKIGDSKLWEETGYTVLPGDIPL